MEEKDKITLFVILDKAKEVKPGSIIELITTFLPAPGIDILKSKGYLVWSKKDNEGLIKTYILKTSD